MIKKIRFILAFIALSICLCLMSNTYSRYVAGTTNNIDMLFAKWQILVNNNDITNGSTSDIAFVPTIEPNENVASNLVAPSSKGYFDIAIDPTNVDVSFKYKITLLLENENIPDLMITKYSVLPTGYIEGDPIESNYINGGIITSDMLFDTNTENFKFQAFTIRVYFEWFEGSTFEGSSEAMNDASDSLIGAASGDTSFKMSANITFEQIFETSSEESGYIE